ncbi:MAG: type II toxin-antitoxin system RelB/DinJ family antitoxin [Cardiobacteriaceae bacterium]|nr:type II toxin-antitoxin system RelB/DinJ family antitoxin [Cardiobacteriaceae bacterium]
MANSTNFSLRIDPELKKEAFQVIESYGFTPSQVMKLFLHQIANTRIIPLDLRYKEHIPNETTRQAIEEGRRGIGDTYSVNSVEELMQIMEKIANE